MNKNAGEADTNSGRNTRNTCISNIYVYQLISIYAFDFMISYLDEFELTYIHWGAIGSESKEKTRLEKKQLYDYVYINSMTKERLNFPRDGSCTGNNQK